MGMIIGWIGALAYSICAIPQAVRCWQRGNGEGLSGGMLLIWLVGGASMLVAVPLQCGWVLWLMASYTCNTAALLVIIRYRFWPRKGITSWG